MEHGILNGKMVRSTDRIKSGKNIGTKIETTTTEQAEKEALSKYNKKLNKDYRTSIEELGNAGDAKVANDGGYLPMLAKKYETGKMTFPCFAQKKLDGLRCTSKKNDGIVTLWFRSGKQITTMKHIEDQLNKVMVNGEIWDGELYNHEDDFNEICGAIRRDKNIKKEDALKVQYWIYDAPRACNRDNITIMLEDQKYYRRMDKIWYNVDIKMQKHLFVVETYTINSEEQMIGLFGQFIQEGYEGIMLRAIDMTYKQSRSSELLKYKEFNEAEFEIVGYEEGRGVLKGCVGAFVLKMEDNKTFNAKLRGRGVNDLLKEYFENPNFIGKMMTVKYQGLSPDGIPRFPVGKVIRFDK
jgi:ATP-dependent DNA ligase